MLRLPLKVIHDPSKVNTVETKSVHCIVNLLILPLLQSYLNLFLVNIVASISDLHAGDQGSVPWRGMTRRFSIAVLVNISFSFIFNFFLLSCYLIIFIYFLRITKGLLKMTHNINNIGN